MKNTNLYSWVRRERERRNLSQAKLSRLTGLAQVHLSAWEHKKRIPNRHEKQVVVEAFRKYDELVKSGKHVEFLKKTRWSKDYNNSRRALMNGTLPKGISREEVEQFARGLSHDSGSAERFSDEESNWVKGISLFSGCGGMTMGFHRAGVKILGHVEIDEAARKVFEHNFCGSVDLGHDIRSVTDSALTSFQTKFPQIDLIFGGPPCQGFSLTGKRDVYDPRNQLYKHFARFVRILRPRAFVVENVRLLTSMKTPSGSLLIDDLLQTFRDLNYTVNYAELNALNYGVPQFRERVFVMGIDRNLYGNRQINFPSPTHSYQHGSLFADFMKSLTLRDAIGDLEYLESGACSQRDPLHFAVSHPSHVIEMLKDVPEGRSAHDNPNPRLRPKSGYNTTYKRLCWDEPASTISTTFGMISGCRNVHPTATRSLTIREALRCQSFPDDFIVFGTLGQVRTMIGNAVPPTLAYAIARHVVERYLAPLVFKNEMVEVASL